MAKVIIKHIGPEREEVHADTFITGEDGTEYLAKPLEKKDTIGYVYNGNDENGIEGTFEGEGDRVIEFVYDYAYMQIVVMYENQRLQTEIAPNETLKFREGTEYEIKPKELEGYDFKEADGELKGIATFGAESRVMSYKGKEISISINHVNPEGEVFFKSKASSFFNDTDDTLDIVALEVEETPNYQYYDINYVSNGNKVTKIEIPIRTIEDFKKVPNKVEFNYLSTDFIVNINEIDTKTKEKIDLTKKIFKYDGSKEEYSEVVPDREIKGYRSVEEHNSIPISYSLKKIMSELNPESFVREYDLISEITFECYYFDGKEKHILLHGIDKGEPDEMFEIGDRDFVLNGKKVDKENFIFDSGEITAINDNNYLETMQSLDDLFFIAKKSLKAILIYVKNPDKEKELTNEFTCSHCDTKLKGNTFIVHTSEYGQRYIYCPKDGNVVMEGTQ